MSIAEAVPSGATQPQWAAAGSMAPVSHAQPAAGQPPSRLAAFGLGVGAAAVAAALAGLALLGTAPLGAGVFAVQVVIALAWLAALDVRGGGGGFIIAVLAAAAADTVVAAADRPDIGLTAAVAGVALLASLFHQLIRKPRLGVTASLGGVVSTVVFTLCASAFVGLRVVELSGDKAVVAALLGAGVALALARLVDLVAWRPAAVPGSRRGIAGVGVGLVAASLVGWAYGSTVDALGGGSGLRLGLVAALLALVADLAVDAVLFAAPPADERARSALPPLGILLPVVLAGPASYVAGRILLG